MYRWYNGFDYNYSICCRVFFFKRFTRSYVYVTFTVLCIETVIDFKKCKMFEDYLKVFTRFTIFSTFYYFYLFVNFDSKSKLKVNALCNKFSIFQ